MCARVRDGDMETPESLCLTESGVEFAKRFTDQIVRRAVRIASRFARLEQSPRIERRHYCQAVMLICRTERKLEERFIALSARTDGLGLA